MTSWEDDKNKRTVAILRVSSAAQRENTSHEIQESEIKDYCDRHALDLVKTFKITESAKKAEDRKHYHLAIDYALAQGVRHIAFYQQDRESRNLKDLEENEDLVKAGRIVLHYVADRKVLDQNSSDSDFLSRDFQGVMNKQYSRVLAAKVSGAQTNKAKNGWFPGGRLPLGYVHVRPKDGTGKEIKRASTTIIVDPNDKNVRQAQREFELRAKGYSLDKIRETVLLEGFIPAGQERKYSRTEIDGRLKNPFYYGRFIWDGVEYAGNHPKIVPENIREAVRISMGLRSKAYANTQEEAIFAGWLRCANGDCGCQITYEKRKKTMKTTKEAKVYNLYHCANSKKVHKGLKGMYADENGIWTQFEGAVDALSLTEELAKDIADALNETHQKARARIIGEMDGYEAALKGLDKREDAAYDAWSSKAIDQITYRRQIDRIREDRQHYTNLLREAQLSINDAAMKSAKDIFELATNATSLWKSRSRLERLAYLKKVTSNQVLDGKTLRYDLRKPFLILSEMKQKTDWSG